MRIIQISDALLFERGEPIREINGYISLEICIPADSISINGIKYVVMDGIAKIPVSCIHEGYNTVSVSSKDKDIPCEMLYFTDDIRPAGIDFRRALISLAYKIDVMYAAAEESREKIAKLQENETINTDFLII